MDKQEMRINEILTKLNISHRNIDSKTYSNLREIDKAIAHKQLEIKNATELIKQNKINVLNISKIVHISRKTFYNNDVLVKFVRYFESKNNDKITIQNLKNEISILKKQISKMVVRDIEINEKNIQLTNMAAEIKTLREKINELQNNKQLEFKN